jgi:beta-lactam-binding protein with PASTA domain
VANRSIFLVACVLAAVAVGGCATEPPEPAAPENGTTRLVIPSVLGLDVENAVAELRYLRILSALVDREHRPLFHGRREDVHCRAFEQDPPPGAEVVIDELTVTVTVTVRC